MEGADPVTASTSSTSCTSCTRSRKARIRLTAEQRAHLGWRRGTGRVRRTRQDWARQVKRLVDEDFPAARTIRLV